jgi:uroporphyrinogen decarboxylase
MTITTKKNDLLLRAARGQRTERTPVWLMRQAGRFDPEYRRIRESCGLPLEDMFRTPELAAEITLLPRRFGVDGLVFFQDILTPLAPMGAPFVFRPGPVLERPIRTERDVEALRSFDPREELPFVAETLRLLDAEVGDELPVLGFAGAPFTMATFMIEGASHGGRLGRTRAMAREAPHLMHALLTRLADMTVDYLRMQAECGADALQLFESVADVMTDAEYREFAHPYHARIFAGVGPAVPRILFVKERDCIDLMAASGADVLSVGSGVDLASVRSRAGGRVAVQGNVDNRLVRDGTPEEVERAVRRCLRAGRHHGHVLNMSHGLFKDTPVENVVRLIQTCHEVRLEDETYAEREIVA